MKIPIVFANLMFPYNTMSFYAVKKQKPLFGLVPTYVSSFNSFILTYRYLHNSHLNIDDQFCT